MASWLLLLALCAPVGLAILALCQAGSLLDRLADRLVLAAWLGVVALSSLLLAAALVVPLTPLVGGSLATGLAALSLVGARTRSAAAELLAAASPGFVVGGALLAMVLAVLGSRELSFQEIALYDTGVHHYGAIRWLSEFGAVRGLALTYAAHGYGSSWFALAAPFDFGVFQGRSHGVTGGFVTWLATLHAAVLVARVLGSRARPADWFLLVGYGILLAVMGRWGILVTPVADLPFLLLTVVVAWSLLVFSQPDPKIGGPSQQRTFAWRDGRVVPLLLAGGAANLKLSALPLLGIAALFYAFRPRASLRRFCLAALVSALLLSPVASYGMISSGCALYPASVFCVDVPWAVVPADAHAHASVIRDWARWSGAAPAGASAWNWLGPWTSTHPGTAGLCLAALLAGAALLVMPGAESPRGRLWVLAVAGTGLAFVMARAPEARFGLLSYGALPVALLAIRWRSTRRRALLPAWAAASPASTFAGVAVLAAGLSVPAFLLPGFPFNPGHALRVMAAAVQGDRSAGRVAGFHFWLPSSMPAAVPLEYRTINGVRYARPARGDQCWGVELLCAPHFPSSDVHLRNAARGFSAGFMRRSASPSATSD